ncbi:GTP 3',8-cyclase MoaA [Leptospira ilyithenensis]|uniref:Radical SAM protein n=1 Tax=Leptospira ilyithenensis TaxID=2484901 RepID=A0A4R9LNV7_9LEPT|nr:GTP 3',8-cyclase MoaA [Leptospira ilyithenensis]TGN08573.1 radical SAM protein [Leptospira ilyithenensis]
MELETRKFEVVRVSVLSHCSFACVYCAPKNRSSLSEDRSHYHFLSPELLTQKLKLLRTKINIKEVHLTGGEPTLHKELPELVERVYDLGIREIVVTSNGFFADGLIREMKSKGLTRMNFSVDSFSQSGFEKISDRKLPLSRLLSRVEEAKEIGLEVKVNCTVLKGYNENEILPLLDWFGKRGITVRYLEFMKMGPLKKEHSEFFYSSEEIRNTIGKEYEFAPYFTASDSTANYSRTKEGYIFGIIANHSEPFCEGCNRLRMDATGKIYGCLSDETSFDLPEESSDLDLVLQAAMRTKKKFFTGSELSMKFIGG